MTKVSQYGKTEKSRFEVENVAANPPLKLYLLFLQIPICGQQMVSIVYIILMPNIPQLVNKV